MGRKQQQSFIHRLTPLARVSTESSADTYNSISIAYEVQIDVHPCNHSVAQVGPINLVDDVHQGQDQRQSQIDLAFDLFHSRVFVVEIIAISWLGSTFVDIICLAVLFEGIHLRNVLVK